MDALPFELIVDIFSYFDDGRLFELCHVCTRWRMIIERRIWQEKRTITEDDLGVNSSVESKVIRLIYFLKALPSVEHYVFPVIAGPRTWPLLVYGVTKETEVCLKQLHVLLKELFSKGRIPVHLDAVNFIENIRDSLRGKRNFDPRTWSEELFDPDALESECSISTCRSIIVPTWPPDQFHYRSYVPWLKYFAVKMGANLEEIVIEKMLTYSYIRVGMDSEWPRLRADSRSAIDGGPSRVRVLSVVGVHNYSFDHILPSVRLRADNQLFAYDEFACLVDKLQRLDVMDGLLLFLQKLQAEGRVEDCQLARYLDRMHAKELLSCFDDEQVNAPPYRALLRRMANSTINHLAVDVRVPVRGARPTSSTLDFLRVDPLRGVTRLDIVLGLSREEMSSDEGLVHAWDCLLQEDVLTRLEFLRVYVGDWYNNTERGSRLLAAPVNTIALPRLLSLQLDEPGSLAHVCSLLRGTPNLRSLRLNMHGLAGDRSDQEHAALWDTLLSAISQLASLVSLSIELKQVDSHSQRNLASSKATASSASTCIYLKEDTFVALSKLVHLDSLSINFPNHHVVCPCPFDHLSRQRAMWRLTAMLPRLRVVVFSDLMLRERAHSACLP